MRGGLRIEDNKRGSDDEADNDLKMANRDSDGESGSSQYDLHVRD